MVHTQLHVCMCVFARNDVNRAAVRTQRCCARQRHSENTIDLLAALPMAPIRALLRHNLPPYDTAIDVALLDDASLRALTHVLTEGINAHANLLCLPNRTQCFRDIIREDLHDLTRLLSAAQDRLIARNTQYADWKVVSDRNQRYQRGLIRRLSRRLGLPLPGLVETATQTGTLRLDPQP